MKNKKSLINKLFCIVATLYCASFFAQNTYAEHTLSLSTSGSQVIDVSSAGDRTSISEMEINVVTSCQAGYNLSLSSSVSDNNLYLNGDPNNNAIGQFFSPSDGINSLVSSDNTWGYYLPDSAEELPTANSVFSAVPTFGDIAILKTPFQTASFASIDDTFSIYYGVKISSDLTSGAYTMTKDDNQVTGSLVYYATLPEDCFRYTIEYNPTGTNTGLPITGTGTIQNQHIAEGVEDTITTEAYGNPTVDGTPYYFIGWNTAQDGSGTSYVGGQSIIDLATPGTTIILYAQWTDCPSEHICYNKNHEDAIGKMGQQEVESNVEETLIASNYYLPRYGFIGWSEDPDAAIKLVNNEATNIYGPNETITTGDLSIEGMNLYAVWLEATEQLQEWNGCDNLIVGDVIALQDARDDNAYGVAKLADGHCWMIENLRLDSEDSIEEKASLAQGYNQSFVGLASAEDNYFADVSSSNSLYSTNGSTGNMIYGDNIGSRFPRYNNSNTIIGDEEPSDAKSKIFSYGNYYTWTAVVANTTASFNMNTATDDTSICPTNWRVPRGGNKDIETNSDFWTLVVESINGGVKPNNYSSFDRSYYTGSTEGKPIFNILKSFPNNFVQSGYYNDSSPSNRGVIGGYWTSVASINNGAYLLNIRTNRVDPGTAFSQKYYGYPIRCLYDGNQQP